MNKLRNRVKSNVIASIGFILSIIALGSSAPTTSNTTQPQALVATPQNNSAAKPEQQTPPIIVKSNPTTQQPPIEQPIAIKSDADISCKVVGISDGDTLTCLTNDKSQIKVRLNQIDAPEKSQAFGTAAKQALSGYVFGKTIGLKTNGTDKYGRTIAEVFVGDKNINKAMVADGYAWAYREYMTDNDYGDLETSARSDTKGLWSEPNPIYPSDFRRGKRGEQTAPVQTQTITQQVEQKAIADSGSSCGSKRYCKQMTTCAEARHYLNDCGVSRLDRDGDGVPCESICN
nr:thermonuclease family protein [Moraxella sp. CTOTU48268]